MVQREERPPMTKEGPQFAAVLEKVAPELLKRVNDTRYYMFTEGELSPKIKTLLVLVCNAVLLRPDGCRNIGRIAREQLGATDEEIGEVMKIAFLMGGISAMNTLCNAFPDYMEQR